VAKHSHTVMAAESGYLGQVDALALGVASWRLGAGRARKEDSVQFGAGIELHAQLGDRVEAGQPLLTLFTDEPERFARAQESLAGGIQITQFAPAARNIILERLGNG
ncbi:MAG: hypothetical protein RLZZ603_1345, partial [Actinomycetota bacterium]